jgi:hypothetical protein
VASSRWNRAAGAEAALVRLSEVTDWEEGGRTAAEHAARIFRREAPEGERRVLVARRQVRGGLQQLKALLTDASSGQCRPAAPQRSAKRAARTVHGASACCHCLFSVSV